MRQIKFRAWDKVKREWFKSIHHIPEGVELSEAVISANVLSLMSQAPFKVMCEKYDFCQFTGLKDKNGKEIYEGDVVTTNGSRPRLVVWDRFAWFLESPAYHDGITWTYQTADREFIDATGKAHEVIGNIYENIELVHNSQKH